MTTDFGTAATAGTANGGGMGGTAGEWETALDAASSLFSFCGTAGNQFWRTHSCSGLSSLSLRKAGCLSTPSGVHSLKRTSHGYFGSTHVVVAISGIAAIGF